MRFSNCACAALICSSRKLARSCRSPRISRIECPLKSLTSTKRTGGLERTKHPPTASYAKLYENAPDTASASAHLGLILSLSVCRVSHFSIQTVSLSIAVPLLARSAGHGTKLQDKTKTSVEQSGTRPRKSPRQLVNFSRFEPCPFAFFVRVVRLALTSLARTRRGARSPVEKRRRDRRR